MTDTLNEITEKVRRAIAGKISSAHDEYADCRDETRDAAVAAIEIMRSREISETALNDLADRIILACLTGVSRGDLKRNLIKWLKPCLRDPQRESGKVIWEVWGRSKKTPYDAYRIAGYDSEKSAFSAIDKALDEPLPKGQTGLLLYVRQRNSIEG